MKWRNRELLGALQIYRVNRAWKDYELKYGINIPKVSKDNFAKLNEALYKDAQYLKKHLTANNDQQDDQQILLSVVELHKLEQAFVRFIIQNLTLKHATKDAEIINKSGKTLYSTDQLSRNEIIPTRKYPGSDNVFFTIGLPDHPVAEFLQGGETHIISVNLAKYKKAAHEVVQNLWIGSHVAEFEKERANNPISLGDCLFEFRYDRENLTKTYRYTRKDGKVFTRKLHFRDEIFVGDEAIFAIAHQMILHLRFIGGIYQQHLLSTVSNPNLDDKDKLTIVSIAMNELMLSSIHVEAKVPVKFPLIDGTYEISDSFRKTERTLTNSRGYHEYSEAREEAALLHFGSEDLRLSPKTIIKAISDLSSWRRDDGLEKIKDLIKQGYNFVDLDKMPDFPHDTGSALSAAVAKGIVSLVKDLTLATYVHPLDPRVSRRVDVNCPIVLQEAVKKGNIEILQLLKDAGADFTKSRNLMLVAASNNNQEAYEFLLACGAKDQPRFNKGLLGNNKTSLMYFSTKNNTKGMELALKAGNGINSQLQWSFNDHDKLGFTALHFAALHGAKDAVSLLLKQGANPFIKDAKGKTPFDIASEKGFGEITALFPKEYLDFIIPPKLVKSNVVVVITGLNKNNEQVVILGKKRGKDNKLVQLYQLPGGEKEYDEDIIAAAAREGFEETGINLPRMQDLAKVKVIYEKDLNGRNIAFVHFDLGEGLKEQQTASLDDLESVAKIPLRMIKNGRVEYSGRSIPVRSSNLTAIKLALGQGQSSVQSLEEDLHNEEFVNQHIQSIILNEAISADEKLVLIKNLLKYQPNLEYRRALKESDVEIIRKKHPNYLAEHPISNLELALLTGNSNIAELLINVGADINNCDLELIMEDKANLDFYLAKVNDSIKGALFIKSLQGEDIETIIKLLKSGLNPNHITSYGRLITLAAEFGNTQVMILLKEHEAKIDEKNEIIDGQYVEGTLFAAVKANQLAAVKTLVEVFKADVNVIEDNAFELCGHYLHHRMAKDRLFPAEDLTHFMKYTTSEYVLKSKTLKQGMIEMAKEPKKCNNALLYAAACHYLPIVEYLAKCPGIDLAYKNIEGQNVICFIADIFKPVLQRSQQDIPSEIYQEYMRWLDLLNPDKNKPKEDIPVNGTGGAGTYCSMVRSSVSAFGRG